MAKVSGTGNDTRKVRYRKARLYAVDHDKLHKMRAVLPKYAMKEGKVPSAFAEDVALALGMTLEQLDRLEDPADTAGYVPDPVLLTHREKRKLVKGLWNTTHKNRPLSIAVKLGIDYQDVLFYLAEAKRDTPYRREHGEGYEW